MDANVLTFCLRLIYEVDSNHTYCEPRPAERCVCLHGKLENP